MTVSPAERAQVRVLAAQTGLDAALSAGAPTTGVREVLDLARDELRRVQVAAQAEGAAKLAEDHIRHEAAAKAMAESARMDLSFALADMGTVSPPEPSLPLSVALNLVAARAAEARHTSRLREHAAVVASLKCRLHGLADERAKVIDRRAEGHTEPGDGPMLALLDADREGLAALVARREQEGPGPDPSHVDAYQRQWDQAVSRERGRILADIAKQLDARLAEVLGQIAANRTGPWFRVSTALETALRGL